MRIWNGSIKSSARTPISRKPCDDWRFRKGEPPARQGHWAYPRSTTGCVSRRWSIAWSRSLRRSLNRQNLYAIPTQKSVDRFKDQIRNQTQRKIPLRLGEVIETINPIIRGWGNYYCRSHVRKRFHQLDGWIIRRLWSHRTKRWRNAAWREYPTKRLRTEFKLVSLVSLIPSLQIAKALS